MNAPPLKYRFPIDHGDHLISNTTLHRFEKRFNDQLDDINDKVVDSIRSPDVLFDFMLMVEDSWRMKNYFKLEIGSKLYYHINMVSDTLNQNFNDSMKDRDRIYVSTLGDKEKVYMPLIKKEAMCFQNVSGNNFKLKLLNHYPVLDVLGSFLENMKMLKKDRQKYKDVQDRKICMVYVIYEMDELVFKNEFMSSLIAEQDQMNNNIELSILSISPIKSQDLKQKIVSFSKQHPYFHYFSCYDVKSFTKSYKKSIKTMINSKRMKSETQKLLNYVKKTKDMFDVELRNKIREAKRKLLSYANDIKTTDKFNDPIQKEKYHKFVKRADEISDTFRKDERKQMIQKVYEGIVQYLRPITWELLDKNLEADDKFDLNTMYKRANNKEIIAPNIGSYDTFKSKIARVLPFDKLLIAYIKIVWRLRKKHNV